MEVTYVDEMAYVRILRDLREDADKTQAQIADMLQVGQRTYCEYEKGKTRIPVDRLIVLARLYNVSMDYISGASDIKREFPKK